MKKILVAVSLLMTSVSSTAADWSYLGEGSLDSGEKFAYYLDNSSIERQDNLRAFWLKYDMHKLPVYRVTKFSVSCRKGTFVKITDAIYNTNGKVVAYNGQFSQISSVPPDSVVRSVMRTVCADYQPPSDSGYDPYNLGVPRP